MSSKINLQTCEYACKSSIFQDNQLIYSEICVIRVQIFILVSLLCEFVTFRRKKYSVVIYEQIRFCEIKSNLNPQFAEKEGDYTGTAEYNAER